MSSIFLAVICSLVFIGVCVWGFAELIRWSIKDEL